jgi:hypothetical protein
MLLDHLASAPSDKQMSVDIGSTLFTLGEFIARFNHDASLGRLRVKFCLFVESAAKRADVAGLVPKDTFANHVILDMIAGWVVIDPKQVHLSLCFFFPPLSHIRRQPRRYTRVTGRSTPHVCAPSSIFSRSARRRPTMDRGTRIRFTT